MKWSREAAALTMWGESCSQTTRPAESEADLLNHPITRRRARTPVEDDPEPELFADCSAPLEVASLQREIEEVG